jgi:hypothetical protein
MLATSKNNAKQKIVMISLHRPATGHGKVQKMARCADGGWARRNGTQAAFRPALERPSHASHTINLPAIADDALVDRCDVAVRKTLAQMRERFERKEMQLCI